MYTAQLGENSPKLSFRGVGPCYHTTGGNPGSFSAVLYMAIYTVAIQVTIIIKPPYL